MAGPALPCSDSASCRPPRCCNRRVTMSRLPHVSHTPRCLWACGAGCPRLEGGKHSRVSSLPSHINAGRERSNSGAPKLTKSQDALARAVLILVANSQEHLRKRLCRERGKGGASCGSPRRVVQPSCDAHEV